MRLRRIPLLLCLLPLLVLAGCSELQHESDVDSGSSVTPDPVGNRLVTIDTGGPTSSIVWVEITVRHADGSTDVTYPFISFPFSTDVLTVAGDLLTAEAELFSNASIVTMQLRDNPAVVATPRTYVTKLCSTGTCITTVSHQF